MRSYGQFCPVALGAEVFAERWAPLILRFTRSVMALLADDQSMPNVMRYVTRG